MKHHNGRLFLMLRRSVRKFSVRAKKKRNRKNAKNRRRDREEELRSDPRDSILDTMER